MIPTRWNRRVAAAFLHMRGLGARSENLAAALRITCVFLVMTLVASPHPIFFVQCPVRSERARSCLPGVGRSAVTSQEGKRWVAIGVFRRTPLCRNSNLSISESFLLWARASGFRLRIVLYIQYHRYVAFFRFSSATYRIPHTVWFTTVQCRRSQRIHQHPTLVAYVRGSLGRSIGSTASRH